MQLTGNAAAALGKYAGDPNRDAATENRQLRCDPQDAHSNVLNSSVCWTGTPHPADDTLGTPCATKFLDVKSTEDKIHSLRVASLSSPPEAEGTHRDPANVLGFRRAAPRGRSRGSLPDKVAALFVAENKVATSIDRAARTPGRGACPAAHGLSAFNVYQGGRLAEWNPR